MILRFADFETAALFAAQRRSEGYFARTLDSGVSHLWGPLPIIGARVVVSEEPITDDAPAAPLIIWSRYFLPALNILALAWVLCGFLILLGTVIKNAQDHDTTPDYSLENFVGSALAAAILSTLTSLFMIRVTRQDRLRPPGEPLSPPMALIIIFLVLGYLDNPLIYLVFFVFS